MDLFFKILLRITTCNNTQRKRKEQLIFEHIRLGLYFICVPKLNDLNREVAIHNICKSTLNLQPESKISIVELQVNNVHTEKFLLCRVIHA